MSPAALTESEWERQFRQQEHDAARRDLLRAQSMLRTALRGGSFRNEEALRRDVAACEARVSAARARLAR